MQSSMTSALCTALALSVPFLGACNDPNLHLETPPDQSVVASPVAVRISWSAPNTLRNGISVTLDGQDVLHQLVRSTALVIDSEDGMLAMSNGLHQLVASAELLADASTGKYVESTVTSNFTVVDGIFTLAIQPQVVTVVAGASASATVSAVRAPSYTDKIDLSAVGLPAGVTMPASTIAAGQTSTAVNFAADPSTPPGPYQLMLTGTGTVPPSRTIQVGVQVVSPTFTQIYDTYFVPHATPPTPGHCYNCHAMDPAKSHFAPGPDKDSFYQGLVNASLIDQSNPAASKLSDPSTSPLRWFNPNGPMPKDNAVPNDQAKADITAWIKGGALNN